MNAIGVHMYRDITGINDIMIIPAVISSVSSNIRIPAIPTIANKEQIAIKKDNARYRVPIFFT